MNEMNELMNKRMSRVKRLLFFLSDIEMGIVSKGEIMAGKDIEAVLKIHNKCNEERKMLIVWKTCIVRYDGVVIKELENQKQDFTVAGEKGLCN